MLAYKVDGLEQNIGTLEKNIGHIGGRLDMLEKNIGLLMKKAGVKEDNQTRKKENEIEWLGEDSAKLSELSDNVELDELRGKINMVDYCSVQWQPLLACSPKCQGVGDDSTM
ncbi:hypothetical protein niasHT_024369 [Heterodera trifolii]|uniref:Uncharacterized protein n=1 Tax=Heterodera trifolii TaxID=157864 RepID=A0ABD2JYS5_9BILA